jgi:hypothetical protein
MIYFKNLFVLDDGSQSFFLFIGCVDGSSKLFKRIDQYDNAPPKEIARICTTAYNYI